MPSSSKFQDLKIAAKLNLMVALVGAVASTVACISFIAYDFYAVVGLTLPEMLQRLEKDLGILALALLVSAFAVTIVTRRIRVLIAEPIAGLAEAVARISAEGNYSVRLEPQGADEVGRLIDSFNEMMVRIDSSEKALRTAKERYALAVRSANDGIWDWDLRGDRVYYSPRWKEIVGAAPDEVDSTPQQWLDRVHSEDRERLQSDFDRLRSGERELLENEHRVRHARGDYRWVACRGTALRDMEGAAFRLAGSISDITGKKEAELQLVHDAFHDSLTDLPNRTLFLDRLGRAVERWKRNQDYLFGVLFLDLDDFKTVNDSLGHLAGDELLVEISKRLQSVLRKQDTVARLGGDEFTVLLEDLRDVSDAIRVADRIHGILNRPFRIRDQDVYPTASIGVSLSRSGYQQAEELLRDADTAMYQAKTAGKGGHKIFDLKMHERAIERLQLESGLKKALELGEFRVHYQPMVELKSGAVVGFEALLRWEHPQRGLLLPEEFLATAEESGIIVPIGERVLEEACTQLKLWADRYPERPLLVSVNMSARQLEQRNVVERILSILQSSQAPAERLRLEVTETSLLRDVAAAAAVLEKLIPLQIQFYLDDFGTGYSSLNHLRQFRFDTLKIDRSFVGDIHRNQETRQIVSTVLELADSLGMKSIAEGVEEPAQLEALQALGCEYAQGFLFSPPVDAASATDLLMSPIRW
ncbi:MAG: EAL domain-containing protein [Armatimonadetes bacterium]|nr:EAL domain-containing protein [Armatimonadota bacterium]